jgi:hypothetical protein
MRRIRVLWQMVISRRREAPSISTGPHPCRGTGHAGSLTFTAKRLIPGPPVGPLESRNGDGRTAAGSFRAASLERGDPDPAEPMGLAAVPERLTLAATLT